MNLQPTILQNIFAQKRLRVEQAREGFDYGDFVKRAKAYRKDAVRNRFIKAFSNNQGINIIAEIKRASPSKGVIRGNADAGETAQFYESFGAAAISVLTEEDNFGGKIEDLIAARNLTELPILRKDFVFDEFQIYESALIGADAILLIVAMLGDKELEELFCLASGLGLDVLVEAHDLEELARARNLGATIIGVNNRNLHTFEVSLDVSRNLVKHAPAGAIMICESGLSGKQELLELKELGFRGFLIGENLMRAKDLGKTLTHLTTLKP